MHMHCHIHTHDARATCHEPRSTLSLTMTKVKTLVSRFACVCAGVGIQGVGIQPALIGDGTPEGEHKLINFSSTARCGCGAPDKSQETTNRNHITQRCGPVFSAGFAGLVGVASQMSG